MTATTAPPLHARPRDLMLVDLDCFYVSVERVRDPALRGRPVIVGGLPHERGVVASASYEARAYGVHAGMPLFQAARRCPPGETVFLRGDHEAYMRASRDVLEVLERFTPQVEPLSLDEALLDLAGCERHHTTWLTAAAAVHAAVREATGLDVSIGIGGTRAVARIALALAKPGGVLEVRRGEEAAFLGDLPLRFLPGVGGRTQKALERFNVRTIGDLGAVPEEVLEATFGRTGVTLSRRARGLDAERDELVVGERAVKHPTISRETSLASDTNDPRVVDGMLSYSYNDSTFSTDIAGDLGIRLNFYMDVYGGGSSTEALIGIAIGVIEAGMCNTVVVYRAMNGYSQMRIGGTGRGPRAIGGSMLHQIPYGWMSAGQWFSQSFDGQSNPQRACLEQPQGLLQPSCYGRRCLVEPDDRKATAPARLLCRNR